MMPAPNPADPSALKACGTARGVGYLIKNARLAIPGAVHKKPPFSTQNHSRQRVGIVFFTNAGPCAQKTVHGKQSSKKSF